MLSYIEIIRCSSYVNCLFCGVMDMLKKYFTFTLQLWQWQCNEGCCLLPFYVLEVLQINTISRICP